MKLTLLFILIFSLQAVASVYSQSKITIKVNSADFKTIISIIQKQSNYHFVYSERKIPARNRISMNLKDANLSDVLDKVFEDTEFTYALLENNLVVITAKNETVENAQVSGTVVDEKNLPIPGVSVTIKGTTMATVTDSKGFFSINVPDGARLVFKFLGYQPQELPASTNMVVRMVLSSSDLSEVVVTALGIKKEDRKIGYAVSTVKIDILDKARESNVAMSLEGRVAGLNVSGVGGGPGSSSRVLLRGAVSQTASSPLYVINGVPMDNTQRGSAAEFGGSDNGDGISNINPDDIETMTVLKGSAASALYGARAANGVILITTKTGSKNSNVTVEYNTNLSYDQPIDNTDFQYEYGMGRNNLRSSSQAAAANDGSRSWGEKLDGALTWAFNGNKYPYVAYKNNLTNFFRTAPAFTNTVSASGGSDKGVFRLSASNLDYQSTMLKSGLNRKTFDLSTSYDIMPQLTVSFNGTYIDEFYKNRPYLSDFSKNADYAFVAMATSLDQSLLAPGYDEGTGAETAWNSNPYSTNPYFLANKLINDIGRKRFITSTVAKYKFTDWMFLQARLGYDTSNDNVFSVTPSGILLDPKGGLNTLNKSTTTELNTDVLFGLSHKLITDVTLDFSAGANYRQRNYDLNGVTGSQFIIPGLYTPSNLLTSKYEYGYSKLQTQSAYYTADFSYKNFLTIGTTGRYDVYSTLPSAFRGIFVPAVSASFMFSELTDLTHLSYGKLRASYAQTSGEPAEPYTTFTSYGLGTPINNIANGTFSRALPNVDLKPYTTNEFEIGTELRWFDNRLGLDVAYFNRVTKNEISNLTSSITSGFTSQYVNLGKTTNKGIELMITGTPVKTDGFTWNTSFNITNVSNKVLDIDGTSVYKLAGGYRPQNAYTAFYVGKPSLQIMAYDYKYDGSGNRIIDANGVPLRGNLIPVGSTLPSYYGGFSNDFNYKNFSLSFLIDFKYGNKVLSSTEYYSYTLGKNKATLVGREGGIVAQGVNESGAVNTVNAPAYNYYPTLADNVSVIDVFDGRFIKFRQATLGYTFTQDFLKKTPFRAISFSLVGRNLFTIMKKTKNIDPESGYNSSLAYSGIESPVLPATRTFGVNANFKFK